MIKLVKGDCFKFMESVQSKSIDVVFTSPPYNRKRNDKYSNYCDKIEDYYSFLKRVIDESLRITKRYVAINIMPSYYNKKDVYRIIGDYADMIQNIIIWEKSNPLPAQGYNITNAYEMFIILGNDSVKSNTTYTKNHVTTSANSDTMTKIHKAVMKQEVSDWFSDKFFIDGDTVYDPFMGLGTTCISIVKRNRDISFIGTEIDEQYYSVACDRIRNSISDTDSGLKIICETI